MNIQETLRREARYHNPDDPAEGTFEPDLFWLDPIKTVALLTQQGYAVQDGWCCGSPTKSWMLELVREGETSGLQLVDSSWQQVAFYIESKDWTERIKLLENPNQWQWRRMGLDQLHRQIKILNM
jgi:hypothetical protein